MPDVRWHFLAGFALLLLAALLGAIRAGSGGLLPGLFHVLLAPAGAFLVASGLAYGFAPPFLKREVFAPRLALAVPALVLVGALAGAAAARAPQAGMPVRVLAAALGAALLLFALHVGASALLGRAWRGGVALFAKDQPFRRGDAVAAGAFALALAGFAAAGVALLALPRGLPSVGVALLLLLGLLPFFGGVLLFLLPRNAKRPMPGLTLLAAGGAFLAAGAVGVAWRLARPLDIDLRLPAALVLLGLALPLVAMLRLEVPEKPGPQLVRARPFLRASFVVAALAAVELPLAALNLPQDLGLLTLGLYLHLVLAALLATACALLGAPILLNAVPREGRWGAWSAALAILGLFLLAPTFQYARPAFPGAFVLLAAAALLAYGVWPMRRPRRECPP